MHCCRKPGHYRQLSSAGKRHSTSVIQEILVSSYSLSPGNKLVSPTTLLVNDIGLPVASLIDSGAKQNLISSVINEQRNIPVISLNQGYSIKTH